MHSRVVRLWRDKTIGSSKDVDPERSIGLQRRLEQLDDRLAPAKDSRELDQRWNLSNVEVRR